MPIEQRNFRRTSAASGPPITTFAALPSVGSVPGQLRQLSDVNNIVVQARDIWRPYGGSQVLAMRGNNPVTVQNLSGQETDSIGPFPGGLVRSGMRLEMDYKIDHSGIGAGTSQTYVWLNDNWWHTSGALTASGSALKGRQSLALDVVSDTNFAHQKVEYGTGSFGFSLPGNTLTMDFSAAWTAAISLQSCAETAVNITGATWSAGVATYTCTAHTLVTGDKTVIAGVSPSGYNIAAGAIVTRIDNNTFSAPMAADPGAYVSGGTSSRISNMKSESYILTLRG